MRNIGYRRGPRVQTSLQATLIDADGAELPVVITDLSGGGFSLDAGESLVVGEEIRLRVPKYSHFTAAILWVEGHKAGGQFKEPVNLSM